MPTTTFANRTLDARPDRVDLRDRPYQPRLRSLPLQYPPPVDIARYLARYQQDQMILDQGREGACTGFGLEPVHPALLRHEAPRVAAVAPHRPAERLLDGAARRSASPASNGASA